MDSIRGLLDENTLQSIAKAAGRGVTEKQVEDVLNAVLPAIEKDSASGTLVSRTNAAVEEQQTVTRSGGTRAGGLDLLSLLLAGTPPRPPKPRPATPTCPTGRPAAY